MPQEGDGQLFQPADPSLRPAAVRRRGRRLKERSGDLQRRAAELIQTTATLHDRVEGNQRLLYFDPVSTLPNRLGLRLHLEHALRAAGDGTRLAVLFIDLDRFKEVNDVLGHRAGDVLLRQVGPRLAEELRDVDTIGRVGGDEFAVVLPDVGGPDAAMEVAERLLLALQRPFEVNGVAPTIDASIGIAMFPEHGRTYGTLFHHADRAMYAAKTVRGTCAIYDPQREDGNRQRLALLGELGPAMQRNDLLLYYQPQVELDSGRATAAEALVRWDRAGGDLLPPDRFVPEAERTGLIHSLTHYVLERALRQLRTWRDRDLELAVAVNLSVRNLLDTRLPETVVGLLRRWEVPPHSLTLEITESVVMVDERRSLQVLRRLAGLGVRLALDDYGTGYASLAYLRRLPIDAVKIDDSLVSGMTRDRVDAAVVDYTIKLAHELGLRVVAEGVEDADVYRALRARDCDAIQGNFLSAALPAEEVEPFVAKGPETTRPASP